MYIAHTLLHERGQLGYLPLSPCHIQKINKHNISTAMDFLRFENAIDSYTTSMAYFAFTGRRGLWVYNSPDTNIVFCKHPNIDNIILVFPPKLQKDYRCVSQLLSRIWTDNYNFTLARYSEHDIDMLNSENHKDSPYHYFPAKEDILDWKYPARIISTERLAKLDGHKYMCIRNRVRQSHKYGVEVQRLSSTHIPDVMKLVRLWAHKQAETPADYDNLTAPYCNLLHLFRYKKFNLEGLVFAVDGKIQATTMWDVSNSAEETANLYMNLSSIDYRGISEFSMAATAEKLSSSGIKFLNLGGSETEGLDRYKNKYVPAYSTPLYSLCVIPRASHAEATSLRSRKWAKLCCAQQTLVCAS